MLEMDEVLSKQKANRALVFSTTPPDQHSGDLFSCTVCKNKTGGMMGSSFLKSFDVHEKKNKAKNCQMFEEKILQAVKKTWGRGMAQSGVNKPYGCPTGHVGVKVKSFKKTTGSVAVNMGEENYHHKTIPTVTEEADGMKTRVTTQTESSEDNKLQLRSKKEIERQVEENTSDEEKSINKEAAKKAKAKPKNAKSGAKYVTSEPLAKECLFVGLEKELKSYQKTREKKLLEVIKHPRSDVVWNFSKEDLKWFEKAVLKPIFQKSKKTMRGEYEMNPKSWASYQEGIVPENVNDQQWTPKTRELYMRGCQLLMWLLSNIYERRVSIADFWAFGTEEFIDPIDRTADIEENIPSLGEADWTYNVYVYLLKEQVNQAKDDRNLEKFRPYLDEEKLAKMNPVQIRRALLAEAQKIELLAQSRVSTMKNSGFAAKIKKKRQNQTEYEKMASEKLKKQTLPNAAIALPKYFNSKSVLQKNLQILKAATPPEPGRKLKVVSAEDIKWMNAHICKGRVQ